MVIQLRGKEMFVKPKYFSAIIDESPLAELKNAEGIIDSGIVDAAKGYFKALRAYGNGKADEARDHLHMVLADKIDPELVDCFIHRLTEAFKAKRDCALLDDLNIPRESRSTLSWITSNRAAPSAER